MSILILTAIFLAAAVIAVPVFKRLGLGAVLGYLAAGAIIGPHGFVLIDDAESILHFSEIGVVLLLFIIGLELQPQRLWNMRKAVFGTGGSQVIISAVAIAAIAYLFGVDPTAAVVVGLALALSSTAFALQIMAEKNLLPTRPGRLGFSTLLFQDMAAIPILAAIPLLAPVDTAASGEPVWQAVLTVIAVILGIVVVGRYALHYVLKIVALTKIREIFTAVALLTVLGTALLMQAVDLSMGLGAFLAGVLLADSDYRHELEADIEPFKGLLLGLFFMAVGMEADLGLLTRNPLLVVGLAVGLVALKAAILFVIGRMNGLKTVGATNLALSVSQGGEFAFVIFAAAFGAGVMSKPLADLLIMVVTLSMVLTPVLFVLCDRSLRRLALWDKEEKEFDAMPADENQVIIAGFGRVGQIVGRVLRARRIPFTALDINPDQVDFVRKFGNKVYYGDASRIDLLRAAKADKASLFVLAIDDMDASLRTARTVKKHFPNLHVIARVRNRQHAYEMMELGIPAVRRETFRTSLTIAEEVLEGLGVSHADAARIVETFKTFDEKRLTDSYKHKDDLEKIAKAARKWEKELERQFRQDEEEFK